MPPKRKKRGRPPGSKNKKQTLENIVKITQLKITDFKETSSTLDNSYVCINCCKSFDKDQYLKHTQVCSAASDKFHMISNNNKRLHCCKQCSKYFKFKQSLSEHIIKEHSELPNSVACDLCSVKCPDLDTLKEHIDKVHERDVFLCPNCNKQFVRKSHVLRHMAQSGCNGHKVVLFPCEICDAKFSRKDNLMVHLRIQHINKMKYFNCKSCDFVTKNFSKLVNHWHNFHSETPGQYECDHCGKVTGSRAAIGKHLEIHGEKKYACDVCGYSTFTVEVMRRHILTHVEEKPFKCNLCNQSYIQRQQLQRHMEKHALKTCEKCDKTFSNRTRLILHQQEHHMDMNKLVCPLESCSSFNQEFANEAAFESHLRTHVGKTYSCEVCGKQFNMEMNMRRHLATHTLDRPRRCMYCATARAFGRGEQLVRHVRKHHPAVFRTHLQHVRTVLGMSPDVERVKKSEIDSILNVLDAESDRIMQSYGGSGVLYGGIQENDGETIKSEGGPLMTEEELAKNLRKLLFKLIDIETLQCFGWPEESVDTVLEKVIEHCGARPADRKMWTRMQCLRENAKHLFLHVIEDKTIERMLETHTIDQVIKNILTQVDEGDT